MRAEVNVVPIERYVAALVAADGKRAALDKAMDGDRCLMTCGDGIDCELGASVDVAAHEDVRLRGLIGLRVCHSTGVAAELDGATLEQVSPHDGLRCCR